MPYTRQQLLAAVRSDHPQLANVEDNKLFAAIAVDHPDLAKGISELQPQASPETSLGATPLGAMTLGVDPSTFMDRIGGAIASVVNPLLPGGDSRNPNAQLPPMTPNQDIGAKAATIGTAPSLAEAVTSPLVAALKSRLPNAARAGANLDLIRNAAADTPVDLSNAYSVIQRGRELENTGHGPMSTGMQKMAQALQPTTVDLAGQQLTINPTRINYPQSFDFASAAKNVASIEKQSQSGMMQAQVKLFAQALQDANREAAIKVGMGNVFDAAMKEYRQAKGIEDAADIAAKWGKRAVMAAALGGTGAIAGKAAIDAYSTLR